MINGVFRSSKLNGSLNINSLSFRMRLLGSDLEIVFSEAWGFNKVEIENKVNE